MEDVIGEFNIYLYDEKSSKKFDELLRLIRIVENIYIYKTIFEKDDIDDIDNINNIGNDEFDQITKFADVGLFDKPDDHCKHIVTRSNSISSDEQKNKINLDDYINSIDADIYEKIAITDHKFRNVLHSFMQFNISN